MSTEAIKKQVLDAFDHRVAVRVYNDQEISREDMEFILDTAWLSPSSIGLEAWRFVVLDRKQIAKLRDDLKTVAWGAQSQLDTASHFVLLLAEKNARYDSDSVKDSLVRRGLGEGDALNSRLATYESFQKNDMSLADNPRALFDWTAKQTYIALGNMMTSASMIGIDSCPIEGFNMTKSMLFLPKQALLTLIKKALQAWCHLVIDYAIQNTLAHVNLVKKSLHGSNK